MEKTVGVSKLLELIFDKKATISDEMVTYSSISSSFLTEDFSEKLALVLRIKKRVLFYAFHKFFDRDILRMLSSHQIYVINVIIACFGEYESYRNIYEKFISVCAVVMLISEETLLKTGMDLSDLNPNIIKVFYQNDAIQNPFLKRRDFDKFVKFIYGHRYLKWTDISMDHTSPDGAAASVFSEQDRRIKEELERFRSFPNEKQTTMHATAVSMVPKILYSTPMIRLPTLPSRSDLIERLAASGKKNISDKTKRKERAETASTNKTSHGNTSSNSDSKPHCFDAAWHENVIQAVIRHNHSKNECHLNTNNQIYEEADGILGRLKNTIKYLDEVLDECNRK